MQLSVVILAAGQGKRMNSDLPKVLQPLAGEPLLQHVISTARTLNPGNIYVVYGHGGAQVQAALHEEPVEWVLQADQLGTGHAVMQAMCVIPDEHTVLVLYGDVPLISGASLDEIDRRCRRRRARHTVRQSRRGARLWAHRAQRRRPGRRDRRTPGRERGAAADSRGQFRPDGGAGGTPARVAA